MELPSKCVTCGGPVSGEVERVKLTICCKRCCETMRGYSRTYQGYYRISKTRAMTEYGCSHEDLDSLQCDTQPNPVNEGGRPMKLYLKAEAHHLGLKRREAERKEEAFRQRGAIVGKRIALESSLGLDLDRMDKVLRYYILGDFLDKASDTDTKWDDVDARFAALDRVQEIMDVCHRPHPAAVFDFCVKNPNGGPVEFVTMREKLRSVFRLEGTRILNKLPLHDLEQLEGTALNDVYEEYMKRDRMAIIRGHLMKWFNEQTVMSILSHPACQFRLTRREEEEKVAMRLREYWNEKDDVEHRTQKIKNAFNEKGVPFHMNRMCEDYVTGVVDYDVEEVVGISHVQCELGESACVCTGLHNIIASAFRDCYYDQKEDYNSAVENSLIVAKEMRHCSILPRVFYFEGSDDSLTEWASFDFEDDDLLFSDDDIYFPSGSSDSYF